MKTSLAVTIAALAASSWAVSAEELSRERIERATFAEGDELPSADEHSPLGFRLQVLLDRADISPGIIDGYYGQNVEAAVRTFAEREGLEPDGELDAELWDRLGGNGSQVLTEYEIRPEDVEYPFVDSIPDGFEAMAEMDLLAYTGPEELLAEKFHMHVEVLKALNPNTDFSEAGTRILVAAVSDDTVMRDDVGLNPGRIGPEARDASDAPVVRIEVDKELAQLRGYDRDDRLLVAYPATIGSEANPSPSGTWEVVVVVRDPNYTYTPQSAVEGPDEALQIPPGPNGPVGSIWIDLSREGYGIHGTPEPADIRRQQSHGCVRLTNWDAEELAELVEEGTEVEFLESGSTEKDS